MAKGRRHPGLKRDRPQPPQFQANFPVQDGGLGPSAPITTVTIGGNALSAQGGDVYVEPTFEEVLALARKHEGWREDWFVPQLQEQNRLYNKLLGARDKHWTAQQRVDRFFDPNFYPLQDPDILAQDPYRPGFPEGSAPWPSEDPIAQEFERLWARQDNEGRPYSIGQMWAYYLVSETNWVFTHIAAIEQKWFGNDRARRLAWEHYADYGAPDAALQRQRFRESRASGG